MAAADTMHLSIELWFCRDNGRRKRVGVSWSTTISKRIHRRIYTVPCRYQLFKCQCFLNRGPILDSFCLENITATLARSLEILQGSQSKMKLASAVGIIVVAVWGFKPLMCQIRSGFLNRNNNSWKKSTAQHMSSYIQPLVLWAGAIFICRAMDPIVIQTETGQIVKQRLLHFVRSFSTMMACAYCLSCVIQQAQKVIETNGTTDTTNQMSFQFVNKAVYTATWVAAISLFMELLGFSAQKWLTAGGLGTVLLTLAGREILTNFLSSAIIHATKPFVLNEWIQFMIGGYEVSGTVEHVGWWSPTIIRADDREAVYVPNHKFTVNVVRNLSQKTHWRIKTHLAISHLDARKINNIVADMRKVLAKNPQVEQQKLHRRVFLDYIDRENPALMILVSCFVKTSHFEEYLCVKEAILLDLLRVIRHHRARLAVPICAVQRPYADSDSDSNKIYADSIFNSEAAASQPFILIEPTNKMNGEDKAKPPLSRPIQVSADEDNKASVRSTPDNKEDAKGETASGTNSKSDDSVSSDSNVNVLHQMPKTETKDLKVASKSSSDPKVDNSASLKSTSVTDTKSVDA